MALSTEYNERIAEIASPRQLDYYQARCELGSNTLVVEKFGVTRRVIDTRKEICCEGIDSCLR